MVKIITALGNPYLNEKLCQEKDFKILSKDIQYQDGIFEILDSENEIDFLVLSEILLGKLKTDQLVQKIKEKNSKIKLIIILENKKEELERTLYLEGVKKIYYNNKVEVDEIINFIKNYGQKQNYNNEEIEKMKIEINNLKELLLKNNINLQNDKILENNKKLEKIENNKKIISISGTGGIGKSIVTLNIANILKEKNQKILIIDFDILNSSLHTILGVSEYSKKIKDKLEKNDLIKNKINVKDLIIKINKKIDLISGINLVFDSQYKIASEKIKFILEELKENYDVIIIDTSSECFFDYTKNILNNSDIILFLIEGNLLEIKKANNLLQIYYEKWNVEKEKINIIINKYNENAIDDSIIKKIFSEYKILGKIKFNKKYNNLINKNFQEDVFTRNIKKDYKIVSDKIIKLNNKKFNLIIENFYNKFKYKLSQKNKIKNV